MEILIYFQMSNLFDAQSELYAKYRPLYPDILFNYISSLCGEHIVAWDIATGNGQAAKELSRYFKNVIGSDSSENQLKFAIKSVSNIFYFHSFAEKPSDELKLFLKTIKPNGKVDLITVAQAIHWFDFPKFYQMVSEFLEHKSGVFACWTYKSPEFLDKSLNDIFYYIYEDVLGSYWSKERRYVEEMYTTLPDFEKAFEEIHPSKEFQNNFKYECSWTFNDCINFIKTWSSYQKAFNEMGRQWKQSKKSHFLYIYEDRASALEERSKSFE
jgi:ubiquinone/menaquinone biosynthesis C-methylase UbiE